MQQSPFHRVLFTSFAGIGFLAASTVVVSSLYALFRDEILHRATPITLDRRNDRL